MALYASSSIVFRSMASIESGVRKDLDKIATYYVVVIIDLDGELSV